MSRKPATAHATVATCVIERSRPSEIDNISATRKHTQTVAIIIACQIATRIASLRLSMERSSNMPASIANIAIVNPGVGWGARIDRDGINTTQHISMCTVKNIPVEVVEARLPVMVDRAGLRQDSGGPGRFRGGLGSVRDYRFLAPFGALTILKKSRTPGWGLAGGKPGPLNLSILIPNTQRPDWREHFDRDIIAYADNAYLYDDKPADVIYCGMFRGEFGPGDVISYLADGGGGYGDPFTREPERVRDDVIDGYVSRAAAERDYGVVLTNTSEIDWELTKRARQAPRKDRGEVQIRRPPMKQRHGR